MKRSNIIETKKVLMEFEKETLYKFRGVCAEHGTTANSVIEDFMEKTIKKEDQDVTQIRSKN